MKNEPHLIFPTFNDQIHIVLQYIDIFQRMLHINKKQSYGIFFLEIYLLIKKLTGENDDNSRLEKLRFQFCGYWGGGGGLNNQV